MSREGSAVIVAICVVALGFAQPPRKLPNSLDDAVPTRPAAPLSPAEAAKQRQDIIKAVKEDLVNFNAAEVSVTQVDGRWKLHTRSTVLKDFAADRTAALDAARIVENLRANQFGSVPGAQPPFEYWLTDGKAPRGSNAKLIIVPVSARTIRAEQVGGAWMISDGQKGIYNFGNDAEACKRAAAICWKHGFNQIGLVGGPQPTMLVPLIDPRQASIARASPLPDPKPLEVLDDANKTGLLMPGNVYAGPRTAIDAKKLMVARDTKGWALTHNGDELARFGADESVARSALRTLQQARPTELVRIGVVGIPLFLNDTQPLHADPIGVQKVHLRPDLMRVTKVRDTWWLFEETRPVMEIGTKEDAEIFLRVAKSFGLRQMCLYGRIESGGLRLFTAGR